MRQTEISGKQKTVSKSENGDVLKKVEWPLYLQLTPRLYPPKPSKNAENP
jgi:hypothetical protein